jgi:hypothetical protein
MTDHPVENMKAFSWIKKHGTTMQQVQYDASYSQIRFEIKLE